MVFVHAHPDDEAIFTGGTIALLAARGWRVVVVIATNGERGLPVTDGAGLDDVGAHRVAETRRAAELLGVARLEFLGYEDSGLADDPLGAAAGAFSAVPVEEATDRLATVIASERSAAVVTYDAAGIYGHPDHVKVHEISVQAAAVTGVETVYEATVDREYLHFVETHLVVEAGGQATGDLGLAATSLGLPTVLVACTVDVRPRPQREAGGHGGARQPDPGDLLGHAAGTGGLRRRLRLRVVRPPGTTRADRRTAPALSPPASLRARRHARRAAVSP